jgi:hypothetical protein
MAWSSPWTEFPVAKKGIAMDVTITIPGLVFVMTTVAVVVSLAWVMKRRR